MIFIYLKRTILHITSYSNQGEKLLSTMCRNFAKMLKQMDFKWKKCVDRKKILMEQSHVLDWLFNSQSIGGRDTNHLPR
jgi:hypothetical protein